MNQLVVSAFAKVNLGLRVGKKRKDGYHDIFTRFQRLSLADVLSVAPANSGVHYFGPQLTDDPSHNLSVKAAKAYLTATGIKGAVNITLTKRIPVGAGLGGGSSDAAAVIRAMEGVFGEPLSAEQRSKTWLDLGADVAFFGNGFSAAIASGRGEIIKDCEPLSPNLRVAILWPGFQVSTSVAYQELDNSLTQQVESVTFGVHSLQAASDGSRTSYINDFEPVIFAAYPDLRIVCDELQKIGAVSAGLAGSGSSLYAIFDDETRAAEACKLMPPPWESFLCRPI